MKKYSQPSICDIICIKGIFTFHTKARIVDLRDFFSDLGSGEWGGGGGGQQQKKNPENDRLTFFQSFFFFK